MVSASRTGRTRGKPGIAYEVQGDGPAVVFLHGIGGHRGNWVDQLDRFSRHYRAVAWDARGYGDSDKPPGGDDHAVSSVGCGLGPLEP